MQTIKVTLLAATTATDTARYQIDNTLIATVSPDIFNKGKYCGNAGALGCCDNVNAAHARKFISDVICNHFAQFGLNVEFVNA